MRIFKKKLKSVSGVLSVVAEPGGYGWTVEQHLTWPVSKALDPLCWDIQNKIRNTLMDMICSK